MIQTAFVQQLHQRLHTHGVVAKIRVNDNRSTMLSIRNSGGRYRVSLHRIFLDASQDVFEALVSSIISGGETVPTAVHAFINSKNDAMNYSASVDPAALVTQGAYFDLQKIYDQLNDRYFDGALHLSITYFGANSKADIYHMILGKYYAALRLIKIHQRLDSPSVPRYVVEFVVFHEMVHAIIQPIVSDRGARVHHQEFKQWEQRYPLAQLAKQWIKIHLREVVNNGRS